MFLFPPINTNYLKQNESVSTDLISFLSFLINDPHAYEQFKSMFQLDDHGNLIVRFKAPEEFELKSTENLQYNLDSQSREATFVFNQEQLNHIFTQNYGIETNCFALKVLLFIASHYELNGKIFENNNIETNLITAPKGFLNEIFNTYPFINFTTSEIYAVKKMLPELPLFIKLDMANDEYNDNHIVIIEISATDEAVLGKRLSDNQPIRYAFSDIEHLEYTAHLFPRNENEKLLMYFISRCDEWEVDNLINQPEIAQMLQLKIELDDSCTYKALQRILMACESKKIRENWSRLNHEQQVSFLNSLESGVKTRAEIFMQFYLQNPSLFEEESVPMEATIALLLQSIELQKLMGNHEDCFFESTNISEEALKGIAQKSLQTLTELAHFFARKGTLGVYEQFSNFLKLKSHNPKLALNLGIYSLEHSFELFGQLPEQIIEELNRHPKFERWFASVHMAADPQGMASQHWVDFKNFIINQEIVFTKQEPYAIASEAEYFIEQLRNLRYKDFPHATVSELVEGDKVSPVIIHAFQDKIKKIEDQARDAILNLIIKELQDLTFNFDECTSKLQLQAFRSKGSNRIFTIVYHPLCVQIAAREANNLSPKLEELHEVATQTYARLEQEYQKHLKPFEMKITAARQRQFNVARAQLNDELERLGGEAHNNLVSILSALDRVEKLVFAGEDVTLNQNLKMQALDDILYNSQNLDQNYPRMPVILRQLNRAVDLLAAEIHSADNVHEYSASGSGFGFFSQQHEARDSDVNASAEISDPIEPINKSI